MKKYWTQILNSSKTEVSRHKLTYTTLFLLLIAAFVIRVYRTFDLMGFYYDQGRDALVIWDLWHNYKPFLIGPITGLKGIYLGPLYYYLIAPFYLIGRGNPVYPAVFLAFLSVVAILLLYVVGARMHSRAAGIIAAIIASFSYSIFTASRWLSNPTPVLLTSIVYLWSLWEIASNNSKLYGWWITAVLMIGLSMQFESASAVFYIPIFIIFCLWQWKKIPKFKYILTAGLIFLATLVPQLIFNFRHDNILLANFGSLFINEKAFGQGLTDFIIAERSKLIWRVFASRILVETSRRVLIYYTISLSMLFILPSRSKKTIVILFSIFLLVPIVSYYLFQGNYGNIYDYYLTGYYLPIVLLFAIGMGELLKRKWGFLVVALFLLAFFKSNLPAIRNYLTANHQTRPISLSDEVYAVDWIYDDALKTYEKFNATIYVPPVIPYAYDYLFLWRGTIKCGTSMCGKTDRETSIFYTLYEPENVHTDRFIEWMTNIEQSSKEIASEKFGQITVEKRQK